MAEFGELIAELRQDRGLTQKQLGKILSVSTGTISNYEKGVHYPDLEKLVALADYFQVSTDYLLRRTGYSGSVQQPQPHQLRDALLEQMMHNICLNTMHPILTIKECNTVVCTPTRIVPKAATTAPTQPLVSTRTMNLSLPRNGISR